jgi:hypothetical protein
VRHTLAEDHAIRLPLTQVELADTLGLTSVHINQILQGFRRDNLPKATPTIGCGGSVAPICLPIGRAVMDFKWTIASLARRSRFASDSPLEGSGFELSVPRCLAAANSVGAAIRR